MGKGYFLPHRPHTCLSSLKQRSWGHFWSNQSLIFFFLCVCLCVCPLSDFFPPCRTPCVHSQNVCTQFYFFNLTLCFSKLKQMNIRWEEGTKDMVTGSRLSTSVRQLCTCLHLTPAKSPSGLLPRSSLYITPLRPPTPHLFLSQKVFPSYCRGNSSAPAQMSHCRQQCTVCHLKHSHATK